MHEIEWRDGLSVGVKEIDDQHKELIRIANKLIKAVSLGHEQQILDRIIMELRAYTVSHFNSEEELMEKILYPKRDVHKGEHAKLATEVRDYQHRLQTEDIAPDAILGFIKSWLLDHILTHDRALARFMKSIDSSNLTFEGARPTFTKAPKEAPQLPWSNKLSVGVPQIDEQHKELIRIANGLITAVMRGKDKVALDTILKKLREYTVFHFSSEEKLMEDIRYPGRGDQAQEHARLKREVKAYQHQVYKHEDITPDDILEFMKGWLLKHILEYDRDLAKFIHEKEAEKTLVEDDK